MPRRLPSGQTFAMRTPSPASTPQGAALRTVDEFRAKPTAASKQWQEEAYLHTREIGEVGYVHNLTANTVAACELRVVESSDDDDEMDPEDPRPQRVMDAFVGPRGGQKELMRRATLNYRIAGEVYLLGTPSVDVSRVPQGDSPELLWEFLSCREVTSDPLGQIRRAPDGTGMGQEILDEEASYVARWWQSDPEFSALPDSAMRRAASVCRELLALEQVVEATTKTRLAAGIFAVPEGMTFVGQAEDDDEQSVDDDLDPFIDMLLEHLSAPIEDRRSAAGLVPLVLRGEAEDLNALRLVDVGRDIGSWAIPLREEALRRLAAALDTPPEMMSGKGDLNHWTGYSVDAEFAAKHVIPLGEALAEFITVSYLRPMLIAFEGMTEAEASRYSVVFDPSNITARADAGTTGLALWKERIIGRKAVARLNNIDEADVMDDEEWTIQLLRDAATENPALLGKLAGVLPGVKSVLDRTAPAGGRPAPATPSAAPKQDALPEPKDPEAGGGQPTLPGTEEVAARLAEQAHFKMVEVLSRGRTNGHSVSDELAEFEEMVTTELVNWLTELGIEGGPRLVGEVERLGHELTTAFLRHAQATKGGVVYENGYRVPPDVFLPGIEALSRANA